MHKRTCFHRHLVAFIVCGVVIALAGCYVEDNSESAPQAKDTAPSSQDAYISGNRQSALGKSMDATESTVDQANDYNDRLMKEIEEDQ